jgi:hypothetical protein
MASTYSDLKIELIGTGEQAGTWGTTTNTNLGTALQEAITGSADVAFSSGDVTLTLTNSNAAQIGRNLRLNLTGTSGGARNLILGAEMQVEKLYLINNTLLDAVTVKNTTGTGIAVPAGKTMFVFNNGTNVVDAIDNLPSGATVGGVAISTASGTVTSVDVSGGTTGLTTSGGPVTSSGTITIAGTLAVANGGTGATTSTGSGSVVLQTSPSLTTPALGTPSSGTLTNCTFPTLNQNTTGSAATFTSTSQNSQFNSVGVGTAASGTGGEIRATNNVTAFYSDRRLKTGITPISDALSKICSINGVTFQSNDTAAKYGYTDKKVQVGVIAQEVKRSFTTSCSCSSI